MIFLKKIVGFMSVFTVVSGAFGVTARPSVLGSSVSRMPTITTQISGNSSSSTSGSTTVSMLADKDCIDAYTACMKGGDICGANFEECTNNTLFFGKKPQCASTLMQCKSSGINSLFGTSSQTSFANKNSSGEYVYPTSGSVLGQLIGAAYVNYRYDTSNCVKKYTSCLKKDDVCGSDFELCTSNTEFQTQKIFCESTLARCENAGKTELFGSTNTSVNPTATSRLGVMIVEGGNLAAVNAVATCYKVADQCILNACSKNPYECKEGTSHNLVNAAGSTFIADPTDTSTAPYVSDSGAVNKSEIQGFIKKSCYDTIGANKFCYATFLSATGAMPTASQLRDEANKDDVFSDAYTSRMTDSMRSKIDDLIGTFNKKVNQSCQDTIVSCAMRSCGGGSGLACYNIAASGTSENASVDITLASSSIKSGCQAVVNGDNYCKYSAAKFAADTGVLTFDSGDLFGSLFQNTDTTSPDPVGAISTLNKRLASSYSPSAMKQMTSQCQNAAKSCIKDMCGTDYTSCYRNRTDVLSTITNSGLTSFDRSMNKVGGVLDRTIIVGLCMDSVKSNAICSELIKANSYASKNTAVSNGDAVWGTNNSTVRDSWLDVGATGVSGTNTICTSGVVDDELPATMACSSTMTYHDADGNSMTATYSSNATGTSDSEYSVDLAANQIFQSAVNDLEMEAQAKYNAKLTKQQNMCLSENSSGIMGSNDNGSTYMWVKLRTTGGRVPTGYATSGLTEKQIIASNELYGSFCRIRITLQSDDKDIQDAINSGKDWSTAYYAAGDSFTCGSWIPGSELEAIANKVAARETGTSSSGKMTKGQRWLTAGTSVLGAVGGGVAMNQLQKGSLGGLLGTKADEKTKVSNGDDSAVNACRSSFDSSDAITSFSGVSSSTEGYIEDKTIMVNGNAVSVKVFTKGSNQDIKNLQTALQNAEDSLQTAKNANYVNDTDASNKVTKTADVKKTEAIADAQKKFNEAQENLNKARAKSTKAIEDAVEYNQKARTKTCGYLSSEDNRTTWDKNGKSIMNAVGAGVGATVLGVGTAQVIKASNRAKFDSEQESWMSDVGNHIRCYIGADEVGGYGDIISTEME